MTGDLSQRTVLFDARWLDIGGPGRVTQHMLRGLAELQPAGDWSVWGTDAASAYLWPGARLIRSTHHPHSLFGQREFPGPRSPRPDLAFYPHQMRPGWRLGRTEITTIHDTIPFRYPPQPRRRRLMEVYLRRIAAVSDLVVTDSEFSKGTIAKDLGVPAEQIEVLPISIDHESAGRIRRRRETADSSPTALYLGADLPHKNLDRLLTAFASTDFQRAGGTLVMVGMDSASCRRLGTLAAEVGARADVLGRVSGERLEDLLVGARLVVQPSLEEGFGLPVAEAMAAGIPVAASTGGSLPEITLGAIEHFDPLDITAMAHAIDDASTRTSQPMRSWPTPLDLAAAVVNACEVADVIVSGR